MESAPRFAPVTGVIVQVADDLEYAAGDSSGWTLTVPCPFTKDGDGLAQRIKKDFAGFRYQPMNAEGVRLDPAAELGDSVSIGGLESRIYTMRTTFGAGMVSDIAAPYEEEIDHEYPYKAKTDRKYTRRMDKFSSDLSVQGNRITAEVSRLDTGKVNAKSSHESADYGTFGWDLVNTQWRVYTKAPGAAAETDILKATKTGLYVNGSGTFTGTITATAGKIGGFDIRADHLSQGGLTWGDKETAKGFYLGVNYGIKFGQKFIVDLEGNGTFHGTVYATAGEFTGKVTATSGEFRGTIKATDGYFAGTVRASQIQSGDTMVGGKAGGYFDGAGLKSSSVTTAQTAKAIVDGIDYANFANDVFNNSDGDQNFIARYMRANTLAAIKELYIFGHRVSLVQRKLMNESGLIETFNLVTWVNY